jgi:hypothetical protein
VSQVRANLAELVNHIGQCDACAEAADRSEFAEHLLDELGQTPQTVSLEERAEIEAIERAWSDNEAAIAAAVTETLLYSIGPVLAHELKRFEVLRPLDIFLATNAVNMLAYSRYSQQPAQTFELRNDGLRQDGQLTVPLESMVFHIRRHAPMPGEQGPLFYHWMLAAAANVPRLFLQFVATPVPGGVQLEADTPSVKHDLRTRWLPGVMAHALALPFAATASADGI